MITRASSSESKRRELSTSSRSLPLNDSIRASPHDEPGSMNSGLTQWTSSARKSDSRNLLGGISLIACERPSNCRRRQWPSTTVISNRTWS